MLLRCDCSSCRHQLLRASPGPARCRAAAACRESSRSSVASGHRRGDDLLGGGRDPLLLAQHLGVVDLLDLDARAAGRRPEVPDAAVGADVLGRTREQQQQRAPRLGVGARIQRQAADELAVQQLGQLGDRGIRLGLARRRRRAACRPSPGGDTGPLSVSVAVTCDEACRAWCRSPDGRRDRARRRAPPPCRRARTRRAARRRRAQDRRSSGFGHRSQRCASGFAAAHPVERFVNSVAELSVADVCTADVCWMRDRPQPAGRAAGDVADVACELGHVSLCRARAQSFEYYSRMRAVDLIRRKRDGGTLRRREIEHFVAGVTDGTPARLPGRRAADGDRAARHDAEETAQLTDAMVRSGVRVEYPGLSGVPVDKHSTGGVGDKTSLILAPLAVACGAVVPMMSGRGLGHTGGTLDKLEAIPGFPHRRCRSTSSEGRGRADRLRADRPDSEIAPGRSAALRAARRHRHGREHPADLARRS